MKKDVIGNAVVCIYKDKKSSIYSAPLIFDNEECALRHFDNFSLQNTNVCDYDLYLIGHYNNQFGELELLPNYEKYLLRSGDEYYDYVSKVKNVDLKLDDMKKLYKNTIENMIKFVKKQFNLGDEFDFTKKYQDFVNSELLEGDNNE